MGNQPAGMNRGSEMFFAVFFLAMSLSIGLTYYHTMVREDYTVFTDSDTVPEPADFVAYLVGIAAPYFHN